MTAATYDSTVPAPSPHTVVRIAVAIAFAVLLLAAFVIGRTTAPDDASATPSSVIPSAVHAPLGQPFESCTDGPC